MIKKYQIFRALPARALCFVLLGAAVAAGFFLTRDDEVPALFPADAALFSQAVQPHDFSLGMDVPEQTSEHLASLGSGLSLMQRNKFVRSRSKSLYTSKSLPGVLPRSTEPEPPNTSTYLSYPSGNNARIMPRTGALLPTHVTGLLQGCMILNPFFPRRSDHFNQKKRHPPFLIKTIDTAYFFVICAFPPGCRRRSKPWSKRRAALPPQGRSKNRSSLFHSLLLVVRETRALIGILTETA